MIMKEKLAQLPYVLQYRSDELQRKRILRERF